MVPSATPRQRQRILVEADDLHPVLAARLAHRLVDLRRVVGPEADHEVEVALAGQRVLRVAAGAGEVALVGADVEDLDVAALQRLPDALHALRGIVGVHGADEEHGAAAPGQRLLHLGPGLAPAATLSVPI
jgi:hypothetical protein